MVNKRLLRLLAFDWATYTLQIIGVTATGSSAQKDVARHGHT